MRRRGITLNELLIAMGIAATVGILASRQMISATRFSAGAIEQSQMEMDKVSLAREIERAFSRAVVIGVSQGAVGGATGLPAGYKLDVGQQTGPAPTYNEGTITFGTDMRPCATAAIGGFPAAIPAQYLNPGNLPAGQRTLVSLHCCTAGNGLITARDPFTGGIYRFPGACTKGRGLTVNYLTGNPGVGNRGLSKCYGNWGVARDSNRAADVNEVGNSIRGLRLAVTGSNPNTCRNEPIQIDNNGNVITLPGFDTTNQSRVLTYRPQNCGNSAVFHLAILSREAATSGEAVNDKIGSQNQADRTSGPDMSAYSEFYGTLGLAGSPRVIDCVTGALDQ